MAPCPPPVLACQDEPIRPGPSGFSDPGGSCIEACFASRPGGGITPVSQWRLTCLTGLSSPRHFDATPAAVRAPWDIGRLKTPSCADRHTIREAAYPGDEMTGVVQLGFASGLIWRRSFGNRAALFGRFARGVHQFNHGPIVAPRNGAAERMEAQPQVLDVNRISALRLCRR